MWKEKYKVGIELVDNQHKELFKRVSDFIEVVQSKESWENKKQKVMETMDFMQDYVEFHFNDEEAYQEKINYPYIEEHKQAHIKFKESVNDYVDRFEKEGIQEDLVKEFGGKLMTWLIMHVAKVDQEMGDYVNSKGGDHE